MKLTKQLKRLMGYRPDDLVTFREVGDYIMHCVE